MVEANIKHSELVEEADFRRKTAREIIINEDDLVDCFSHLPNAAWDASSQIIVGKNKHGDGRIAEVLRDAGAEPVVVEEYSVEVLVKELRRKGTLELVKAEVQVLEGLQ